MHRRDQQAASLSGPSSAQANPRIAGWNKLVDELKHVGNSREEMLFKIEMVNGWVNTAISFDDDKNRSTVAEGEIENWFSTPKDTLISGKGVCSDMALLKYETLRKIGFKDEDLKLVSGQMLDMQNEPNYHMVATVKVNGKTIILNSQQVGGSPVTDVTPRSDKTHIFSINAGVEPDDLFANGRIRCHEKKLRRFMGSTV